MINDLIFNVLLALIVAILGAIASELIPYIKTRLDTATEKLRRSEWAWAAEIIDAVVRAVEQTAFDCIHGEDKKAEAMGMAQRLLNSSGIQLTEEQIDTLIEAAVKAMNDLSLNLTYVEGSTDAEDA